VPPRWVRPVKKPEKVAGKVVVTMFKSGWCPVQNLAYERAKRASGEIGEKVLFREYDTTDPQIFREWGIMEGLYIDGKEVNTGPPPSYEKILRIIEKKARKL
jgi:hypothetical protein